MSTPRLDENHGFLQEAARFRASREERIRAPYGWLSVVGLHWLEPGDNLCGADPQAQVPLPRRAGVPERALRLVFLEAGRVRVSTEGGVRASRHGAPFTELELTPHEHGFDSIELPGLVLEFMRRGARMGVRIKDAEAPARRTFPPFRWYPAQASWVIQATLEPRSAPLQLAITNVLGDQDVHPSPGPFTFELAGRRHALTPVLQSPGSPTLFFMFRDRTNGHSTYGAGRFLFAELSGETISLDFNRAVSPPCVFTPHATCPLPPACNVLDVPIEAGEMSNGGEDHDR